MKTTFIALRLFLIMTVLTGIAYPLFVTGTSQLLFKRQAQGSLLTDSSGQVIGSELIAQKFIDPKFFWPRPSAVDYNPLPSGGSNLGPTSEDLKLKVEERRQALGNHQPIPSDLLFASGSGLDPHISPLAAFYQIDRISQERALTKTQSQDLKHLIDQMTEDRSFGILGEKRVNVLKLNLELEKRFTQK